MDLTRLVFGDYPPELSLLLHHQLERIAVALERSDQANLAHEARKTHQVKDCDRLWSYNSNQLGSRDVNQVLHDEGADKHGRGHHVQNHVHRVLVELFLIQKAVVNSH